MNILVTAGNTRIFIDEVRCLTNIFTGRTGAAIALEAYRRGHRVTLLTSQPPAGADRTEETSRAEDRWQVCGYDTLEDLRRLMEQQLKARDYGALIHSAAVSDYLTAGVFAPAPGTRFTEQYTWHAAMNKTPVLVDRAAGKVKSDESELWLRLVRAPKLVDRIRAEWAFRGILVKFKLEVGLADEQLLDIAEKSRIHSQADLMVANTLEGASSWAYVGPVAGGYVKIVRGELPAKLMDAVENSR